MKILEKNEIGKGILIENDGYVVNDSYKPFINEEYNFPTNGQPVLIDCILQKWGVENRNGRIYPEEILKREVTRYEDLIKRNSAISEADHPSSSVISLHNISHSIKKMWWKDNILYGTLEIITSPAYLKNGVVSMVGDKIVEYLKRGIQLGISSRGVGSLKEVNGKNIVQDDFELICFDLVASPSTPGAYLFPNGIQQNESLERKKENILENKIYKKLEKFLNS
ncbi:MAG: hypothetical protein ACOC33_02245 [bacterium]